MFEEEDGVKEMEIHGDKISYQDSEGVYFVQNKGELMRACYVILKFFVDQTRFLKKLLEKAGLTRN